MAKQCLNIHKVTASGSYYARAVDPTLILPLNYTVTEKTKAIDQEQAATNRLLDYM
jgi:hypothetical protein